MRKLCSILTSLLILALFLCPLTDVQAKRLGGGRSFGGKPAYTAPLSRSQLQTRRPLSQTKPTPSHPATPLPSPNRNTPLGWLAPFLAGGLLGSLLFGGAFQHLNMVDFLAFAGLALLAFKLLARRPKPAENPSLSTGVYDFESGKKEAEAASPFATDLLFTKGKGEEPASLVHTPAGFDVARFLDEAKQIFLKLQAAWNDGDLAEIRGLSTDEAFMEMKAQKEAEGTGTVEVEALEAQLLDYQHSQNREEATVLFSAWLSEDGRPMEKIEEIWHFIRFPFGLQPTWRLDGIQQIES